MSEEIKPASGATGLLLCDDLMFSSRITGTARDLGLSIRVCRTAEQILNQSKTQPPACVIVDLANPGLDIAQLCKDLSVPRMVAFGSHVETETLRLAREAGCEPVLPRSAFVAELPKSLSKWFGG